MLNDRLCTCTLSGFDPISCRIHHCIYCKCTATCSMLGLSKNLHKILISSRALPYHIFNGKRTLLPLEEQFLTAAKMRESSNTA